MAQIISRATRAETEREKKEKRKTTLKAIVKI